MKAIGWLVIGLITVVLTPAFAATSPNVVMEEFSVPSTDPGINLYIRNRHPEGLNHFSADKILLYVHGAAYPSETTFDLPLNNVSWMRYIAQHGYDVYLVDVRGYGRSTRPKEMDQAADQNAPFAKTEDAVRDVGTAVDFILKRRSVSQISLMGWSWGTTTMGSYTVQNPSKVLKLIQYAPVWLFTPPLPVSDKPLAAYRTVTVEELKKRWYTGVPDDKKSDLIPPGWFDAVAAATFATDQVGAKQSPPVLRVPNGVLADRAAYWGADKPLYDPGAITVPTLIVHAEWDADLPSYQSQAYFSKLTSAPYKRMVEIGEGTHFVMMEKNRMQLFQAVQQFLDEKIQIGE